MSNHRYILLSEVTALAAKDPTFVPEAIDAATEGVKLFAQDQRDDASKLAAMLLDVMHTNEPGSLRFTWFTPEQILAKIEPWYRGTEGQRKLVEKWGAPIPSNPSIP